MPEINGWHLPGKDGYFTRFVEGTDYKKNGFQREHLLAAFGWVRKWDVAIDVGAHVGFWTRDMAERFTKVYAFEPADDTYACLKLNMAEHVNVTAVKLAVGADASTCCSLNDGVSSNTGSRYIMPDGQGDIGMMPLDAFPVSGCDLLKIDVEGFELFVLQGARHLIQKYRPVVIMECDKKFAGRYGLGKLDALRYLTDILVYQEVWRERPDRVFIPRGKV
jgi:FkbM family methyltransferase